MYSNVLLFLSVGTIIFTVVNSIRGDRVLGTLKRWEPAMDRMLERITDEQRVYSNDEEYLDEMWDHMKKRVGSAGLRTLLSRKGSPIGGTPLDQRVWKNDAEYVDEMFDILKGEVGLSHLQTYIWNKLQLSV